MATYDLAIIGGGPAGVAGGIYAARQRIKTLLLTSDFLNQSSVSPEIKNWVGEIAIPGTTLCHKWRDHLYDYQGDSLTILEGQTVKLIKEADQHFIIQTETGEHQAKHLLICTGAKRRRLNLPEAANYEHRGITYCASCDGPLFADQAVAVIGGGNAGFETAGQLLAYASQVTLLEYQEQFRADTITVQQLRKNPKFQALSNVELIGLAGQPMIESLTYRHRLTGQEETLPVTGIFVEIGFIPNTAMLANLVNTDPYGAIIVNPKTQVTSHPKIWSAGDCTDGLYRQNNIAAGDAIKAIENIYSHLLAN